MLSRVFIVGACLLLAAGHTNPAVAENVTVITGATVVHPSKQGAAAVEPGSTIVISGDRIQLAGAGITLELPQGATIIDGRGKWVIPGLIDSHVHFFQSGNLYTRPDAADFNAVVPYADEVARNKARLNATFKVWLASGVTGVVDIGGPFWNFDMRDRAAASPAAPRVAVAGPLLSMVDRPQLDLDDPPIVKITSVDAARALVARELERNPDYIKVWFIHEKGDDLAAQEAIVKAAGDAAHAAGKRLAVHATELVVAKASLRAGADFLVHSVRMRRSTTSSSRSRRRTARSCARRCSWWTVTGSRSATPGRRRTSRPRGPTPRSSRRWTTSQGSRRKSCRRGGRPDGKAPAPAVARDHDE